MKNRLKFIIPIGIVLVIVVVLVVLNPLGGGGSLPRGNSTNPSNGNSGVNTNLNRDSEGEQTNPGGEGEEIVPITFRISPGKFYLDDEDHRTVVRNPAGEIVSDYIIHGSGTYQAGESREYQLIVTNLNAFAANFSVDYRVPDNVVEGYSRPTSEVRDWVWISSRTPEIPAGETMAITIRLGMPSYATPPGDKWEFWIGVIDKSQTGWIRTELANRWLVTMP